MWTYHINKANVIEVISGVPFPGVCESPPLSPMNTQLLTEAAYLVHLQFHSQQKAAHICSCMSDRSSSF